MLIVVVVHVWADNNIKTGGGGRGGLFITNIKIPSFVFIMSQSNTACYHN